VFRGEHIDAARRGHVVVPWRHQSVPLQVPFPKAVVRADWVRGWLLGLVSARFYCVRS